MSNQNLLIAAVLVIIVAGLAYTLGQKDNSEPQGVLGNAAAAVGDKISQAGNQMEADADKQSASDHMDAAKENLGIK